MLEAEDGEGSSAGIDAEDTGDKAGKSFVETDEEGTRTARAEYGASSGTLEMLGREGRVVPRTTAAFERL